jgi:hypothetical protein
MLTVISPGSFNHRVSPYVIHPFANLVVCRVLHVPLCLVNRLIDHLVQKLSLLPEFCREFPPLKACQPRAKWGSAFSSIENLHLLSRIKAEESGRDFEAGI